MSVVAPSFGKDGNPKGALHEFANREDIDGFVIVCRLADGRYEHFRVNLDPLHHSFSVAIAQENLMRRMRSTAE